MFTQPKVRPSRDFDKPKTMRSKISYPPNDTSDNNSQRYLPLASGSFYQKRYRNPVIEDAKLPDIRFRAGHVKNDPLLTAIIAANTTFNGSRNRALQSSKKQIPCEEVALTTKSPSTLSTESETNYSSGHFAKITKTSRAITHVVRETRLRRPFNTDTKNAEIGRRVKAPGEVAVKKRWVPTLRSPSHSGDRNLHITVFQESPNAPLGTLGFFTKRQRKAPEHDANHVEREEYSGHAIFKAKNSNQKKLSRLLDTDSIGSNTVITTPFGKVKGETMPTRTFTRSEAMHVDSSPTRPHQTAPSDAINDHVPPRRPLSEISRLSVFVGKNLIGNGYKFNGPFGLNVVTYLDYIASGRPLRCIESYIRKHVMPTYANTHTTVSYTGMQTTLFREEARDIIRKSVNASDDDYVIFTGSGVTSAINKLVHTLNIGPDREEEVFVFVGPYEHHSNILPWMYTKATVTRIHQDSDGLIDVSSLASHLETICNNAKRKKTSQPLIIGAFSAASNVTGILSPVDEISSLIHRYDGFVIWDYACAGPYVKIDMNPPSEGHDDEKTYKDAIVISPHKFVGGPGTPGVLISKKWMFQNPTPHNVGGGTVLFVRRQHHLYYPNPEHSEEGGTPAILESIRAGLVFKLKDAISAEYIMKREDAVMKNVLTYLEDAPGLVILGNTRVHRLAILPFLFYHETLGRLLHHDFMAMLFNDVFGIQVRSGCACAAPYGLDLLGMSEELAMKYEAFIASESNPKGNSNKKPYKNVIYKPGFVRFSLPYFITAECLDFVMAAIHMTATHGWAMLPQYKYNRLTGDWSPRFRKAHQTLNTNHLSDVEFKSGAMKVNLPSHDDKDSSDSLSDSTSSSNKSLTDYEAILFKAESLFRDALAGAYDCPEETDEEKGETEEHEEELRWFIKPVEAANLIHGRRVTPLDPDDLPFMPGALASKINYNPKGHRGRSHSMDNVFILEYFPKQ